MRYKSKRYTWYYIFLIIKLFTLLTLSSFSNDLISGYYFSEKSTQEIQNDDFSEYDNLSKAEQKQLRFY